MLILGVPRRVRKEVYLGPRRIIAPPQGLELENQKKGGRIFLICSGIKAISKTLKLPI